MEIQELLAAAKREAGIPSDNQLSKALGATSSQITEWRRQVYYPKDETCIQLCELAGVPTDAGLMWLNVWRADEKVKPIYEKLARDAEKRASKSRKAA